MNTDLSDEEINDILASVYGMPNSVKDLALIFIGTDEEFEAFMEAIEERINKNHLT